MKGEHAIRFPHKQIRSRVIKDYVDAAGYRGVVVFSCGNSAAALREQGLEVVEIGPSGELKTGKWWTQAEIHRAWPDLFDATSGHLSVPLMCDIAKAFKAHLGGLPVAERYTVPTGSGETICCLRVAYPLLDFVPTYDNGKPETEWHPDAPLNPFVDEAPGSKEENVELARMMGIHGLPKAMPPRRKGNRVLGFIAIFALAWCAIEILRTVFH
jgi:hypothetical protein